METADSLLHTHTHTHTEDIREMCKHSRSCIHKDVITYAGTRATLPVAVTDTHTHTHKNNDCSFNTSRLNNL